MNLEMLLEKFTYISQLLIYLYDLEISVKMSFEKPTRKRTPCSRFAVHVLNCKVRTLLSF